MVVDTDATATKIIDAFNKEGIPGRVTFVPLNRVKVSPANLPDTPDARPMINELEFHAMFKPVFEQVIYKFVGCEFIYPLSILQVFGKTLICKSIDIAADYAKTHGLNCVTIEGDQVNRRGALTGGFYDIRYSRIDAMKAIKQWRAKLSENADSAKKVKAAAQDILFPLIFWPLPYFHFLFEPSDFVDLNGIIKVDQEVDKTLGEIEKLKVKGEQKHNTYEQMNMDLKLLTKDQLARREALEQKVYCCLCTSPVTFFSTISFLTQQENLLATLNVSLRQLEESVRSLESELGTALLDRLSPAEQTELTDLTKELTTLKETQIEVSARRAQLEGEKNRLYNLLTANLLKRKSELQDEIDNRKIAQQPAALEQMRKELERVEALIEEATRRQKGV